MAKTKEQKHKLPKLTKKQLEFVRAYLETGNGVKSALKAYNTRDYGTAAMIASENLTKPKVKAYLESKAEKAAEFIYQLAETSEVDSVRLNASKDILDRAGFKVAEPEAPKSETHNTYNFIFNSKTQADVNEINERIKARLIERDETIEED